MLPLSSTKVISASKVEATVPALLRRTTVSVNLSPTFAFSIASKRIAVPGCHASGFIALTYPLIEKGIISEGMIPKVECCTNAIKKGVKRVFIIDGRVPHSILIETLTDEGVGTMFVQEKKL